MRVMLVKAVRVDDKVFEPGDEEAFHAASAAAGVTEFSRLIEKGIVVPVTDEEVIDSTAVIEEDAVVIGKVRAARKSKKASH